jgi:NTP pyrophosphatase (non-canonical NTP hydrolase)
MEAEPVSDTCWQYRPSCEPLYPEQEIAMAIDNELTLNELRDQAYHTAVEKGWWVGERNFGELCMLIDTEVAEAYEEYRNGHAVNEMYFPASGVHGPLSVLPGEAMVWASEYGWKPEGVPSELADIVIRVADICGHYGIDLNEAVRVKMAYNANRSYRHGGKIS